MGAVVIRWIFWMGLLRRVGVLGARCWSSGRWGRRARRGGSAGVFSRLRWGLGVDVVGEVSFEFSLERCCDG